MILFHVLLSIFFLFLVFLLVLCYILLAAFIFRYLLQVFYGLKRFILTQTPSSVRSNLVAFGIFSFIGICALHLFEANRWFSRACYALMAAFAFRYLLQFVFALMKSSFARSTFSPCQTLSFFTRKKLIIFTLLCFFSTGGLYLFEYSRWFSSATVYRNARQYMVVGMVLMDFRAVGVVSFYPERAVWKPAVWLQQWIMSAGMHYLPEKDSERAIWKYHFILAPYINRIHAPRSKAVYPLIETSESILESLANGTMADTELAAKDKYIVFSMTAFYYQYVYGFRYSFMPSTWYEEGLSKDQEQYEHLKQVVEWSVKLEKEWQQHSEILAYMRKNPEIELAHIVGVSLLLHEIIWYQIYNLLFTCEDRYLDLFYTYINKYTDDDSPYFRVDRKLQKSFNNPVIYHGEEINFFGHRLCQRPKFPGYNIREIGSLGPNLGWYDSFLILNKRLVPEEKQQEVLDRFEPWEPVEGYERFKNSL